MSISASTRRGAVQTARPRPHQAGTADGAASPPPWDLLLICTAVYVLTAVARVHVLVPLVRPLRPTLVAAALGLGLYLLNYRGIRTVNALRHPVSYLLLFIVVWATLGAPFGFYPGNSVRFLYQELYKVAALTLLVAAAVREVNDVRRLLLVYAVGAITFSALAAHPGVFRRIGAGGYDPNDSAMFVVSALPVILYFVLRARTPLVRAGFTIGMVLCCVALVTSGSRGGFVAFLALLAYLVFFFRGVNPVIRVGAVAAVVAVFAFAATDDYWERMRTLRSLDDDYNVQSLTGRKQVWKRGMGYMLDNPLLGVGIWNFNVAEGRHPAMASRIAVGKGTRYSAAHSIWVQVGAELGIPGFLAFTGAFALSIVALWRLAGRTRRNGFGRRNRRREHGAREPPPDDAPAMAAAVLGLLVALMAAGTFLSQAYGYSIWAAFGLVVGLVKVTGTTPAPRRVRGRAGPRRPRSPRQRSWDPRRPAAVW